MTLQIINAKVQYGFFRRRTNGVSDKGKITDTIRKCKVLIGSYLEFNDGWSIHGPDGRIHKGKGTVVRFNYRHQTWSIQRPQCCETNVLGYVFTVQNEPCWLKAQRESGFTTVKFRRNFSPSFVKICIEGQDRVLRERKTRRRRQVSARRIARAQQEQAGQIHLKAERMRPVV
jgi:hypothetical protein